MTTPPIQLELFQPDQLERPAKPSAPCEHKYGFQSYAFVPSGHVCSDCGELLCQRIPQPPEVLGYVSADWHWHYVEGRPWISSEAAA